MIVVDTTVWIDFFRAKDTDQTMENGDGPQFPSSGVRMTAVQCAMRHAGSVCVF